MSLLSVRRIHEWEEGVSQATTNSPYSFDLLGACLCGIFLTLVLYRAPLTDSFWLDELLIVHVLGLPLSESLSLSINSQAQSPLYMLLLKVWSSFFGFSEISLRLPSLLAVLLSGYFLWKIAEQLKIPFIFGAVLLPFFSLEDVILPMVSARPYACALLSVTVATYFFLQWLSKSSRYSLFYYVVSMVVAFYFHYLFLAALVGHLALLIFLPSIPKVEPKKLSFLIVLTLLILLPGIFHLWTWKESSSTSLSKASLTFFSGIKVLFPRHGSIYLGCSLLMLLLFGKVSYSLQSYRKVYPYLLWWCCASTILFLCSLFFGLDFFVPRYFGWRAIGFALLAGSLLSGSSTNKTGYRFFVVTYFYLASFLEGSRIWEVERWRDAAALNNQLYEHVPVSLCSGLRESLSENWLLNNQNKELALSPLRFYGVTKEIGIINKAYPLSVPENVTSQVVVSTIDPSSDTHEVCGKNDGSSLFDSRWTVKATHNRGLVRLLYLERTI